jgi:iron complex outermembrane receptor protein
LWGTVYEDNDGPPAQMSFKTAELNCNLGGTRGRYWCGTLPDVSDINASLISGNYDITPYMYQELIDNRLGFYDLFDQRFSTDGGIRRRAWQGDARIEFETGGGYTFTALTSAHKSKTQNILDLVFRDGRGLRNPYFGFVGPPACPTCALAALPFPTWLLLSQGKASDFNQELRVTSPQDQRLRWVAGANYLKQNTQGVIYGVKTNGTASSGTPGISHPVTPSVFGGLYFDIVPELTATAEARYQWDKVKNDAIGASTGFLIPNPSFFRNTFTSFAPRVSLDYKFSDASTAYVLFSRGYRPGGFNTALTTQPPAVLQQFIAVGVNATFDEEKIDNYEAGVKVTFWDGRARATLSVYRANWRNGQITTNVPFVTQTGQLNLLGVTANLGAVNLKGGEFEADFKVTENLELSVTGSLNDSTIKVFTCGDCLSIYGNNQATGNRLGQAEKYKYSLSADYRDELVGDYEWFGRVDYAYRGKYFLDASNRGSAPARHIVNARVGVATESFQIYAYGRNLTNDDGLTGHLGLDILTQTPTNVNLQNEIRIALPDKRTFGLRASYNF